MQRTAETIEMRVAKNTKHRRIQATILAVVGVTGVLAVGAVAPNAAGLLAKYATKSIRKGNAKQNIAQAIQQLRKQGKIQVVGGHYELTNTGRIAFQRDAARATRVAHMNERPRWDGKWRIVMFDVDEKHRARRDQLRDMLQSFGFRQLQKSVWVYPYPCEELFALLQIELRVRHEAVYLVAEAIQGEEKWRTVFSLLSR